MAIKTLIYDTQFQNQENYYELKTHGFYVHVVRGQQEFLSAVQTITPDVIIINSTESEKNRILLYPSIRSMSGAPILVLAVLDEPGIIERALDNGADEYLLKPVSSNLLSARIRALARRSYIPDIH